MAIRRMFSKTIIEVDNFLDLPIASQMLYIHLNMAADDDGFIGNLKRVVNSLSLSSEDDLKLLFMKGYLISFPSGVVVIAHWRIHNYIRKDRYTPTIYQEELNLLKVNKAGLYFLEAENQHGMTFGRPCDIPLVGVGKVGKVNKDSIGIFLGTEDHFYFDRPEVNEAFLGFIEMRKKINKPMTDRAISMMINKLKNMAEGDPDLMVKILDQAVQRSSFDLYEYDGDRPKARQQAPNKFKNYAERENDYGIEVFSNADFVDGN